MSKRTRRKIDAALRATIALEALRERAAIAGQVSEANGTVERRASDGV